MLNILKDILDNLYTGELHLINNHLLYCYGMVLLMRSGLFFEVEF